MSRQFIDRLRIFVQAGCGASGNPTLRGKGGNGGSVYLEVREDQTLHKLLKSNPTKRFKAAHGLEASKRRDGLFGRDASDLTIPVPPGISVLLAGQGNAQPTNQKGSFTPKNLGDLDSPGQRLLVAQGGMGGMPQSGYLGSSGQAHSIILDLKLMADYSLLGLPNAGKSSLLRAVSNANVKIASYPFTTIRPQVAYCKYEDGRSISLADLPGLADIYAQYSGKPSNTTPSDHDLPVLRHTNFLKHVERSSCLILVLDSMGFQRDQRSPWRSPLACAYLVIHLLERWSHGLLLDKPFMCVINKIDLPDGRSAAENAMRSLERFSSNESRAESGLPTELLPKHVPLFENIHMISAFTGANVNDLKIDLRKRLDTIALRNREHQLREQVKQENTKDKELLFDRATSYF
ncbi:GTP-binding protein 10 [Clonorchis sinensis]|uniref:GTP-binding protein 10 n=1 Tax=Clonorchis sinensis TaxID=79923 RepID=A0A419QHB0_CLOSI|nr:GTP-binding protein 10 [Clonorchis sinensis]